MSIKHSVTVVFAGRGNVVPRLTIRQRSKHGEPTQSSQSCLG